jgi:hypothetical protein
MSPTKWVFIFERLFLYKYVTRKAGWILNVQS